MKLTKKDIGKKFIKLHWSSGWVKIQAVNNDAVLGVDEDGTESSYGNDDFALYRSLKSLPKYEQLFKKFGCNEESVKELITEIFKDLKKEHILKKKS